MAGFKTLKDVSTKFDEDVRRLSSSLYCVKIGAAPEDVIAKKLHRISLLTSKYRLLRATEAASTPETAERVASGADIITDYEQLAQNRVLEAATVKCVQQSRAVRGLLSAADSTLDPELRVRKDKIKDKLSRLHDLELTLQRLDCSLLERQEAFVGVQARWDELLGEMRDRRAAGGRRETVAEGPLYDKLRALVDKMEMMRRWLGHVVTSRGTVQHDWLADRRPLTALRLTRRHNTVAVFTRDD